MFGGHEGRVVVGCDGAPGVLNDVGYLYDFNPALFHAALTHGYEADNYRNIAF